MKTLKLKSLDILILIAILYSSCSVQSKDEGQQPTTTIHEAAFMGNVQQIERHIAAKSDLNEKDPYGSSPLTIAAIFGKNEVAGMLIDAGADINIKSADGSTPLHSAAFFGRDEIVEMLLAANADLSVRNNYGATALESVNAPFADMKPVYDQIARDLGPLGLKLDYERLEKIRPVIAEMILNNSN
jgi:uncharacterized protein